MLTHTFYINIQYIIEYEIDDISNNVKYLLWSPFKRL